MKNPSLVVRYALTLFVVMLAACEAQAAGFQRGFASDPDGKPLDIGIWYPSAAAPRLVTVGVTTMTVAVDGPVQGKALPLVVMSHGTGGSFLGNYDTAIALADAGFVVAAVTHTGDNYVDQSRSTFIMDRPRHMSRLIDHMLASWDSRGLIDSKRVGMFGFSAGGFTTLVSIGARADFSRVAPLCRNHPGDYVCRLIAKSGQADLARPDPSRAHDRRVKAAVVAAPALGFTLPPDQQGDVKVPVQLWRAENDEILPHPRYAEAVQQALSQSPDYRVVANAGHFDFMAPCNEKLASIAPHICASAAGFDRDAFHKVFNGAVAAFFNKNLR